MCIEQILIECELSQSTFRGGLKCECVKTEQRVQQRPSDRERFYINRFKGYKAMLYRWCVVVM